MKSKKTIAISLCALMTVSFLAGCSGKEEDSQSSSSSTAANGSSTSEQKDEADPFAPYDKAVTFTVGMSINPTEKYPEGDSPENNQYTRYIKEKLNVDVEVVWTASNSDYNQKVNLAIASDDLPDGLSVNDTQFNEMVKADQLEELTTAYEENASPVVRKMVDSSNGLSIKNMTKNGKQYALASVSGGDLHNVFIRKDWMDKLGLTEPKTMDDIVNIAKEFMEKDPGGNGAGNTVGIVGPNNGQALYSTFLTAGTNNYGLDPAFNGFDSYPGWWVEGEDGLASYGSLTGETKNALTYLSNIYKEGILDPEMGIRKDSSELIISGKCGIMFGGWWVYGTYLTQLLENNPDANMRAYLAPVNTEGDYAPHASSASPNYVVVRKGYENPEVVVKLSNLLMRDEGSLDTSKLSLGNWPCRVAFGMRNEKEMMITSLRKVLSGEAQAGDFAGDEFKIYKTLKSDSAVIKKIKKQPYDNLDIQYWDRTADPSSFNRIYNWMVGYSPFIDNPYTPIYSLTYSMTPTMEQKWATLKKLEDETFMKIIMGVADPSTFDDFVESWNEQGGTQITEEVRQSLAS